MRMIFFLKLNIKDIKETELSDRQVWPKIVQDFKWKAVFDQRGGTTWGTQRFLWKVMILTSKLWISLENVIKYHTVCWRLNILQKYCKPNQESWRPGLENGTTSSKGNYGGAHRQSHRCHHLCHCLLGHRHVQCHPSWNVNGDKLIRRTRPCIPFKIKTNMYLREQFPGAVEGLSGHEIQFIQAPEIWFQ